MPFPDKAVHVRHYFQSDDSVPRQMDLYYLFEADLDLLLIFEVAQTFAEQEHSALTPLFVAWLASDSIYLGCTAHVYQDGVIGVGESMDGVGDVGSATGDTCPDYVAAVIRRYTTRPGPAGRGRVFVPCVAEAHTNTSSLNDTGFTKISAIRDYLIDDQTVSYGEGPSEVLMKPAHYNRKEAGMFEVITWYSPTVVVTQRRRRLRQLQ